MIFSSDEFDNRVVVIRITSLRNASQWEMNFFYMLRWIAMLVNVYQKLAEGSHEIRLHMRDCSHIKVKKQRNLWIKSKKRQHLAKEWCVWALSIAPSSQKPHWLLSHDQQKLWPSQNLQLLSIICLALLPLSSLGLAVLPQIIVGFMKKKTSSRSNIWSTKYASCINQHFSSTWPLTKKYKISCNVNKELFLLLLFGKISIYM